ncbi:carbohydrate ABC transporter membrane protein 1 (CUT1 family) [Microcella alkaliphila]|uniref:Maltose/maltodextrin transport system permease protein n=1 Tax=Microcella alkaliphila TaxID=279828 RepID=A0A4Q7TMD2_9MICO|nr:carbohydrate ABC transporter membrane protein 1 (CUT1 family) [Microcella alkaliphila]
MSNTTPGTDQPVVTPPPRTRGGGIPARVMATNSSNSLRGWAFKIVLLGLVDSLAVFAMFVLFMQESWLIFGITLAVTLVINWIYLRPGGLPAKYLAPGLLFLAVFQIFVVVYSGYIAFTNYGDGRNGTKEDAIANIQLTSLNRVPDSPTFRLQVLEQGGDYAFLVTTPTGEVFLGSPDEPLAPAGGAELDSTGKAVAVDGYTSLSFADLLANQRAITTLSVPFSDDPADGALRTPDGSNAYLYLSALEYDEATDTFTDAAGVIYRDGGNGAFVNDDGRELIPGWTINVGFDNFVKAFTSDNIRGPLISVTIWTFAFAILSVATTFALGLFLAIVFNKPGMKGKKAYRLIMILPYAFPGFLSGLVWLGLFNQDFGYINQVLFGGASIPWLTDPWLAKISVLTVNLWLGFPYMFLICTGALQSIPEELTEAATVDGAKPWAVFRLIKFPLLLVSVAPLLISSFAFNFNNFNIIYMLTGGGPRDVTAGVDAGATDILITLVYKVAFGAGTGRDYGLASAFAILIFIIVATVSIISFRQTKALEELN